MKWYYRFFVVAILAAALIGPYFIKKPDGSPIMDMPTASDFIPDNLLPGGSSTDSSTNNTPPSSSQTYYKWQDDQGQWHYGDQPPTSPSKVSTLQVDPNTNIIQSLKIEPEIKEQPQQANQQEKLPDRLTDGELSFDNAVNALNDATLVRDMMESRNDQLKAIVGD
jgi:hypothetical protein|tara:strand:- start:180 stop:677 length:498 start_codon:yes stop_codon:yes gene_type:complete